MKNHNTTGTNGQKKKKSKMETEMCACEWQRREDENTKKKTKPMCATKMSSGKYFIYITFTALCSDIQREYKIYVCLCIFVSVECVPEPFRFSFFPFSCKVMHIKMNSKFRWQMHTISMKMIVVTRHLPFSFCFWLGLPSIDNLYPNTRHIQTSKKIREEKT